MPELPAYLLIAILMLLVWFAIVAVFQIFAWIISFLIHAFLVIFKFIFIGFLLGLLTMYIMEHNQPELIEALQQLKGNIINAIQQNFTTSM